MPRATHQVDDNGVDDNGSSHGGLNALDDLFGILDSSENKDTQGDFTHPTLQNTRAVWADLCSRLGVDPGVLSGGLADDDVGSDHPDSDAVFCRTCPHILPELQHPETTWRSFGGPTPCHTTSTSSSSTTMSPALKNCFCNHHCSECPRPSVITAALTLAASMSKSKKGSTSTTPTTSAAAAASTVVNLSQEQSSNSPFHGHCLGCLGEFLVNKQYALDGQSSSKRGGGGNAAAEFYPCLCLASSPDDVGGVGSHHLLQHFEYHQEQAGLALDELDALDDNDEDYTEESGRVDNDDGEEDLVCVTNNGQATSRADLEQLHAYHRQHCLYTFAIGLANEPIHVLYCASCNIFAPLCNFTKKPPQLFTGGTAADNKSYSSNASDDGSGATPQTPTPKTVWLATDTASTLLYKMLLVAHVSLAITASSIEKVVETGSVSTVESSVQHIKDAIQNLNELAPGKGGTFTSTTSAEECSDSSTKRLFMFKPCVAAPVQIADTSTTTPSDNESRAILRMCEMLDQEKCDAINDTFFEEGVEETIYEALCPMLLPHHYLKGDTTTTANTFINGSNNNSVLLQESMTAHRMMSASCVGLATIGVSYGLQHQSSTFTSTSGDQYASGELESAVGFVVDFTSANAVQSAISKMNTLLLKRGLEIWGYQLTTNVDSKLPISTPTTTTTAPSMVRYLQSLLRANGQDDEASQLESALNSQSTNNKPSSSSSSLPTEDGLVYTLPVLQLGCSAGDDQQQQCIPTVYIPTIEASNHPDITFIDVVDNTRSSSAGALSSPFLKLVPTQFLTFTMVPKTVRVVPNATTDNGLIHVTIVQEGDQYEDVSASPLTSISPSISIVQYSISSLLNSSDTTTGKEMLAYVQNIEGMRFSTVSSGSALASSAANTSGSHSTSTTPRKQALNTHQHLLDNTEPHSAAARALGQLAIAGGCPLSQPAANLQLMNTVATIARVIGAIWEKFGGL